ncbi:hypothetical protein COO60DRAFT_929266 [Scenedesmus sp. NREL 46B-D3]|nr:hypothetical protein COO60DRAFT_929266 [Scenedesmus sp. NREL 46B-D3]
MDLVQLSERRIDELVAAFAVYGDRLTDVTPAYQSAAEAALQPDGCQEAGSTALRLAGCSCSGALLCECGSLQATLVYAMPPGYPAAAAMRCQVASPQLSRVVTDTLGQQLQQKAEELQGNESLHELADTLQQLLRQLPQQQKSCTAMHHAAESKQQLQQCAPQAIGSTGGSSRDADVPVERLLLRLDHMRSKASYSRTIKQWAADNNLTGFLLFCHSLIIILLEGCPSDLARYLYLARTVCVDVDAAGRKCRERMMTVLEDSSSNSRASAGMGCRTGGAALPAAWSDASACGSMPASSALTAGHMLSAGCGRTPAAASQTGGRAHKGFRVLEVADLAEVVRLLAQTHPSYTRAALLELLGHNRKS